MITKMDGSTYRMLLKDKRVASVESHPVLGGKIFLQLANGWRVPGVLDVGGDAKTFDNWEAARNWVRKAIYWEAAQQTGEVKAQR
jgi:nitrogen fixation protein